MELDVWFEFASTYSYLSICRVEALAASASVRVRWRPFLLGPIFRDRGLETSPFVLDRLKGDYMWRDVGRRAEMYGLAFRRPDIFPANGLTAARIMSAAEHEPWSGDFARRVFHAQFVESADISDDAVLASALSACGVDPAHWLNMAREDHIKAALRQQTTEARALGLFGAPSFVVGDEMFWGDDRLEDAIACAARQTDG